MKLLELPVFIPRGTCAPAESPDRRALTGLRVSLARVAQALNVETPALPVLGKEYVELIAMARGEERGWNALAATVIGVIESTKEDLDSIVKALGNRD